MSKSAKGNRKTQRHNVRQLAGLNRAIGDQGRDELQGQLAYKLDWNGSIFLAVTPKNTRRTYPACWHICTANRTTQAAFVCISCGYLNYANKVVECSPVTISGSVLKMAIALLILWISFTVNSWGNR